MKVGGLERYSHRVVGGLERYSHRVMGVTNLRFFILYLFIYFIYFNIIYLPF